MKSVFLSSLAVLAMTAGAHAAGNACATLAGFKQLTVGMTYEQIVGIFGCKGEEVSSGGTPQLKVTLVSWRGAGTGSAAAGRVTLMFQNGRLAKISQFGLE